MPDARAALPLGPLLHGPARDARVLGAFPSAVYIAVGETVVALVAPDGIRLPIALVLSEPARLTGIRPGRAAVVGDGGLVVGALRVRVAGWWDPRPRVGPLVPEALAQLRVLLAAHPAAAADRLPALATALATGDATAAEKAADRLLGYGPGLTPAGDDILAGTLAALRLFGDRGFALPPRRTTSLSAALLACAARGEVAAPAADLLRALGGSGPVEPAAQALLRVGHSSGRDLAAGIALGAGVLCASGAAMRPETRTPPRAEAAA